MAILVLILKPFNQFRGLAVDLEVLVRLGVVRLGVVVKG